MPDDDVPQSDRHQAFSDEREIPQLPPSAWAPRPTDPVEGPAWRTSRASRSSVGRGWWWGVAGLVALGMCTSNADHGYSTGGGMGKGDVQCTVDASERGVQDSPECRDLARRMGSPTVGDAATTPLVLDASTPLGAVSARPLSLRTVVVGDISAADLEVTEVGGRRTQQVALPYVESSGEEGAAGVLDPADTTLTATADGTEGTDGTAITDGSRLQCQTWVDGVLVALDTAVRDGGRGQALTVTCAVPVARAR